LTAYLDTNVLIRHFTGEPPALARRSKALLESGEQLILTDLIVAECVHVLESFYELEREQVVQLMRSAIAFNSIITPNAPVVLRALELYGDGHDYADSYLVACAEESGAAIASFDRGIDKIGTVARVG
jgi:predicted nucleic acid-binding protein